MSRRYKASAYYRHEYRAKARFPRHFFSAGMDSGLRFLGRHTRIELSRVSSARRGGR